MHGVKTMKANKEAIMNKAGSLFLAATLVALPATAMAAYQGGDVKDGGSISGTVKFKGTAPAPKKLDVGKDKEVCDKSPKYDQSLVVNNGNIEYAVITITDIQKGKKVDTKTVQLDQKECQYHPHVLAFPAGTTVQVLNPDGILHNIHSYSKVNSPFNMAQPKFKKTLDVKVDKPEEPIEIKCDVHGWMHGWMVSAENPYVAVTDQSGSFKLTDVPPGTYTVQVWQEKLGKSSQKVTVKAKEDAKVNFDLAGK
jgi:plastocyanin